MRNSPQKRAVRDYRDRLARRGMARFEVLGLAGDRDLIRSVAKRLAKDGQDAAAMRAILHRSVAGKPSEKGRILDALRRSPLIGADLDLARPRESGRKVEL